MLFPRTFAALVLLQVGCTKVSPDPELPTPIRHLFVLLKENHTFDNYFTGFPGADTVDTARLSDGGTLRRPRAPDGALPRDVDHAHYWARLAYADGGMNGFDLIQTAHPPSGPDDSLPFIHYEEDQLPNYWAYARSNVLCDRFFTTVLGPSSPGHLALVAAQAPIYGNPICFEPECGSGCKSKPSAVVQSFDPETCATSLKYPCLNIPTVFDELPASLSWRIYGPGKGSQIGTPLGIVRSASLDPGIAEAHFRDLGQLAGDLAAGDEANLTWVIATAPDEISEHPPADPCTGENWSVAMINGLMQSPHWNETALVAVWDDWGGFYDHVAPPSDPCPNGEAFSLGFRIPALVISPYAREGFVLHETVEQSSVVRLAEELFGLPWLTAKDPHARDERAGSLLGAFDFAQAPRPPMLRTPRTCARP